MAIFGGGSTGGGLGIGIVYSLKDEFSNTADKIKTKMSDLDRSTTKAAMNINSGMRLMASGAKMMAAGLLIAAPIGFAINEYSKLQSHVANVSTLIEGDTAKFSKTLTKGIQDIMKVVPKSADDLGAASYDIFSAGITDTSKALDVLSQSSKLAVAGLGTTKEAVNLMTSSINSFKNENLSASEISEILFKTVRAGKTTIGELAQSFGMVAPSASALGVKLSELQAATAALTTTGMSASIAQTQMRSALVALVSPNTKMNDALKKMGVSSGRAAIEQWGLVGTLEHLKKALGGNETAIADAMGRVEGFNALLSLTGNQAEIFKNTLLSMTDGSLAMAEAFNKQNKTFANQFKLLRNNISVLLQGIGNIFAPVVEKLTNFVKKIISTIEGLTQTKFGQFIIKLVGGIGMGLIAIGLLTSGMGLFKIALGSVRIMAMKLTGTLTKMAAVLMANPIMWILIPIAGIVFLIVKAIKSFNNVLDGTAEPASGFIGIMQKIGGVLKGIGMIWKSATSEGFSMTQQMHDALEKLGILDLVVSIGTWIVRVKEFFRGVGMGIKAAYTAVIKPIVSAIKSGLNFLVEMLEKWGINIRKNTSEVNKWAEIGKIVGIVIMATLVPAFISLAISVIAATWPILVIIGAIVGIIMVIKNWSKIMDWFGEIWQKTWGWIKEKAGAFWDWMKSIPERMYNWGASIVQSIRNGIQSAWGSFESWLTGLWDSLMKPIQKTMKFLGLGDNGEVSVNENRTITQKQESSPIAQSIARVKSENTPFYEIPPINNNIQYNPPIFNIKLDSREIAHEVESVQEESSNRT